MSGVSDLYFIEEGAQAAADNVSQHVAHRWAAPKASKTMVKWQQGNVSTPDMLMRFVASLPNLSRTGHKHVYRAPSGHWVEHIVFDTCMPTAPWSASYWHGTTFHCLADILRHGLKNPFDQKLQEFTDVGIYVADELTWGGAFYHGVATRFSAAPYVHTHTYIYILFVVWLRRIHT